MLEERFLARLGQIRHFFAAAGVPKKENGISRGVKRRAERKLTVGASASFASEILHQALAACGSSREERRAGELEGRVAAQSCEIGGQRRLKRNVGTLDSLEAASILRTEPLIHHVVVLSFIPTETVAWLRIVLLDGSTLALQVPRDAVCQIFRRLNTAFAFKVQQFLPLHTRFVVVVKASAKLLPGQRIVLVGEPAGKLVAVLLLNARQVGLCAGIDVVILLVCGRRK